MQNENEESFKFPPEVEEIFDIASQDDNNYSAMWVPGGIQLVDPKDKTKVIKEHYWPDANEIQRKMLISIVNAPRN
jgi:hypothetical protein